MGKRYLENLKGTKLDDLFLKYALNTKHKTFGEDSYAAFKDILDVIMPYRSGREYRVRELNLDDTFDHYSRQMNEDYPFVVAFGKK